MIFPLPPCPTVDTSLVMVVTNGVSHIVPNPHPTPTPAWCADRIVFVKRGDTLWHIAVVAYGGTQQAGHYWRTIAARNRITSTAIHPGQALVLPSIG